MICMLKGAKDSAIRASTQAVDRIKSIVDSPSRTSRKPRRSLHCRPCQVGASGSVRVLRSIPRRLPSTPWARWPAATVNSARRFISWKPS